MYGGGKLLYAADARLNEFDVPQMERVMLVGLWCVHPDHGFRPSIRQAMSVLQFVVPPPDLPRKMMVPLYYMQQLNGGGYRWHYESSSAGSSGDGEGGQPSMPGSLMGKSHSHGIRSFSTAGRHEKMLQ
ncbi:unnamed protein product [Miscanthus lutarioriparius]|uniref:Uncharacterized protein n=1 Tax=Miscanthus lutarioriparius TaxID=422564 RepID=A0A811RB06_9POAL|nr:unnamed protein product [Miscanthus lutarioriparius]